MLYTASGFILVGSSGYAVSNYDPDVHDFVERVRTDGGQLSVLEMNALDFWVRSYKQNGLWSKVIAHYPFVGGSGTAQSVLNFKHNLKSSSYKLTTGNLGTIAVQGASCTSTGLYRFGNNSFFSTGYNLPNNNNLSVSIYSRTNIPQNGDQISIGATNEPTYNTFHQIDLAGGYFLIGDLTGLTSIPLADTRGFFTASRTASNLMIATRNGVVLRTDTHTNTGNGTTSNIGILGRTENSGYGFPDNHELTCASIAQGWTAAEEAIRAGIQLSFERMLGRAIEP